jgi:HSP20 family molecular chaperone IbpA
MTASEYLASITKRCSRMTAEEMMRNLETELERNRLGYGHYLFDDLHSPFVEWSVPGALDLNIMKCEGGFEVVFTTSPFQRDELTVHVEEGLLQVVGSHEEIDEPSGRSRSMRISRRVPLPPDVDIDGIDAKFSEGMLVIRVPQPRKGRRLVKIH